MQHRTMTFSFLRGMGPRNEDLVILLHTTENPTDDEWNEFLAAFDPSDLTRTRALVLTAGGGPSLMQRKALVDFLHGRQPPVAVVSSRAVVRGILRALSWFNPNMSSFPEGSLGKALDFLRVDRLEHARVRTEIRFLQNKLEHVAGHDAIVYP
jgi:hypothetical protein